MEYLNEILAISLLGNDLKTYAVALLVLAGIFLFFKFLFIVLFKRLEKYAKKTKTDVDDAVVFMIENNRWLIFLVTVLLYVMVAIQITDVVKQITSGIFNVLAVLLTIRIANYWVQYFVDKASHKKRQSAEKFSIQVIGKSIKILVWVFAALFLISSFGYNISSLIAGLGIGGLAVALAVQNILGDLISAVSIYLDKPFQVGDYVVVGTQMGTIKNIGLKTTRITSIQGEEIVMSNKKLTETDINNFGRIKKRRVTIPIGVTYDTKLKKMEKIPDMLKEISESVPDTVFDRAFFKSFGDYSKMFELICYVESQDYYTYCQRLHEINLKIQEAFEKSKIDFAYPTQTVHLKRR